MSETENCIVEELAHKEAIQNIKNEFAKKIEEIVNNLKENTENLTEEFEYEQDLARGIATSAGATIGAGIGGPIGATVGGAVGDMIGNLFVINVDQVDHRVVVTLPAVTMNTTTISFDTPAVTMKDKSIIFDVPEPRMTRQKVGEKPEVISGMETQCIDLGWPLGKQCADVPTTTVRWKPIYADIPTIEMVEKKIVITMPVIEMMTQEFKYDMPTVEMKDQDFVFSLPSITIKFTKDAGQDLSNEIKTINRDSNIEISKLNASMKENIKNKTTPLLLDLMNCKRKLILVKKKQLLVKYDGDITTVRNAISNLKINNVPEEDNDFVEKKNELKRLMITRNLVESQFDEALEKFDAQIKKIADSLIM
ncbi:hypothetical protein [Aquimarina sediminis]|uniref:hypothetical protein n=1 Tax=Aquimarina sediminis TaxID=2070536 RepID=UPI000CA034D8|nr:hypothetical protein [Aquimarina sediminis]